jgi:hypothetical protein
LSASQDKSDTEAAPQPEAGPSKPAIDPAIAAQAVDVPLPKPNLSLRERLGMVRPPRPAVARPRKHGYTGLILSKKGDAEIYAMPDGPAIRRPAEKGGGLYVKETAARFWVPAPIPAGWLTIWSEDDPEPFTGRDPIGYGSRILDILTGSHVAHVLGLGLRGSKELQPWMKWALVALVGVTVLAFGGYWFWKKYHGA